MTFPFTANSQEEFDEAVKVRLAREVKKYEGFDEFKAKAAKYDELVALDYPGQLDLAKKSLESKDAELSDWKAKLEAAAAESKAMAEKHTADIADLQAKVTAAETVNMKVEAAMNAGLPYSLASRLSGTTPEELKADAEGLAPLISGAASNPFHETNQGGGRPAFGTLLQQKQLTDEERLGTLASFVETLTAH